MTSATRAFRPDIEGVRGLAILAVVLFHAGVPWLAGGFVGVDVFFVLSGYFITQTLAHRDEIDLVEFYGQRALRILPTLFVVLLATLAAVMFLYAPIDRADFARTAASAAMSSSNIDFASESVNYFSTGENPLLHTWSLGVEQQFYLVWPLLFLLVGLTGSTHGQSVRKSRLTAALAVVAVASLATSVITTETSQPWAFFGLPARIWEFALGGILALAATSSAGRRSWLPLAGLAAIAVGILTYDRSTPYPGWAALLPAAGAAAIIVGGHAGGTVTRLLSTAPLRWLGRMSYGWYLWHWPLVGLGGVLFPTIGVAGRLTWSAAALGAAWITYRLVEIPAQTTTKLPRVWRLPIALLACGMLALVAVAAANVGERQASRPEQRAFAAARDDHMRHDCWGTTVDDPRGACEFGDVHSSTVVVLFGDSHAEHWLGAMDEIGRRRGWKIALFVKGGCPVADVPQSEAERRTRTYRECTRLREQSIQRIIGMRPSAAILSSWDHYVPMEGRPGHWQVTVDDWQRGLRQTYARISAAGIPAVAIRGTPRTWFDVPACLSRRAARLILAGDCSYALSSSLSQAAAEAQANAARSLGVQLVDMNDEICADRRCGPIRNGTVVFTDDNHLTASFSRSLAPALEHRVDVALETAGIRLP